MLRVFLWWRGVLGLVWTVLVLVRDGGGDGGGGDGVVVVVV